MILTEPTSTYGHLDHIGDLLAVGIPLVLAQVAALYHWTKGINGSVKVAKDVSTNHLPFVYTWLRRHNDELGTLTPMGGHLSLPDHPNIVLVPNGSK